MSVESIRRVLIDLILWEDDPKKLKILLSFCSTFIKERYEQMKEGNE